MAVRRPFVVGVSDLLRRAGLSREVEVAAPLDELKVIDTAVPDGADVRVAVRIESLNDSVVVKGTVTAPFTAACRRCLTAVEGEVVADVLEVFEPEPTEGETYPLEGERIDLEPLARESVLLELPVAPLCREACEGLCPTCGADRSAGETCDCAEPAGDPRWSALEGLTFDEPTSG